MSSQATADGALTLTVTFALGTDLDNAQVQVQNRVARRCRGCPQEVQRIGVTTEKASPDFIMVVHLVSPDERYDMLYLANYAHLQREGRARAHRRRRQRRRSSAPATTACASGSIPTGSPSRQLTASDVVRAIREQNVQVAAGVLGAPPAPSRHDVPALDQHAGPADRRGGVRRHRRPRRRRRADHAASRRRPRRARLEPLRAAQPARQQARGGDRHLPAAGLERARRPPTSVRAHDGAAEEGVSRGRRLPHRLRPDDLRARVDRRGRRDAVRGDPAGRARRDAVPADLARVDHPAGRGAGLARRHVRGHARRSASRSTRCRCSAWCSRSASSSTTRSSWSRTSSGTSSWARRRSRRRDKAMEEVIGPDHRDRAGAVRGVRADRVRQRADRPVLPAVRADDRDLDGHLGVQLADAEPGAGVAAAAAARRAARSRCSAAIDRAVRLVLPAASTAFFTRASARYASGVARVLRVGGGRAGRSTSA